MVHPEQSVQNVDDTQPLSTRTARYRVNIYANMPRVVYEGDLITLTGEVIGFENRAFDLQWQIDDGGIWKDVPGATEPTCCFRASQSTINLSWRLYVTERNTV